jgi:hypothetical protein
MAVAQVGEAPAGRDDRVLTLTRIVAAIIVPILVVAFGMLYLLPSRSGELFAWAIQPQMSAMMLGATYLGGAYFFGRVVIARRWHTVTLGLLPVSAFAAYLGIATLVHWDRFNQGHVSFSLWAILYLGLPFVLPVIWWRNQRTDPGGLAADEIRLPGGLRIALGLLGGLLGIVSLLLLLAPDVMIPTWPWTISPLTAKVMGAMFVLPGLVGLGIAIDGRWSAARIIIEAQVGAIALILGAILFSWGDFDASRPVTWLFVGGMAAVSVSLGGMYIVMQRRTHA